MKEYIIKIDEDKKDIMGNCPLAEKPMELVRCKDCKYGYCINPSYDEKEKFYECMKYPIANLRITHKPDWFCADGERAVKLE